MTAKEKAEELVNKFRYYADGNDDESDRFSPAMEKQNGKNCAIIAVDEIIDANPYECDGIEILHSNISYWQEVKKEIYKL
jgi:hypothetical protein